MSKQKSVKEKDNYFKLSFLFPVIYSLATAVLMFTAIFVSSPRYGESRGAARFILRIAAYSLMISPSALIVTAYVSMKHVKKYPDSHAFYQRRPMIFSFIVMGLQILYLLGLTV